MTSRTLSVPEQRPYLEIRMRANDVGDHRFVISIDGRELMSEILSGKEWRNFVFDLTPLKGKNVEVALIHHNTQWFSEHAYLQAPRFIDKPAANVKVFRWTAEKSVSMAHPVDTAGTIDALALLDPAQDAVRGEWKRTPEGVECTKARHARIQIPLIPPAEYDFSVTFTRRTGDESLSLIGSQGNHDFQGMLSGWNGRFTYLGEINGTSITSNPTRKPFGGRISNGKRQTAVLEVRKAGVRLLLDGDVLTEWKTNYQDTELSSDWKLRDTLALGLGVFDCVYTVHAIRIREVEGVCKPLRGIVIKRD